MVRDTSSSPQKRREEGRVNSEKGIVKSYQFASILGMALVVAGALLLIVGYIAGWTSSNVVLLTGLIIIILGAFLHIKRIKSAEKY
jgi:membrane-bound ClpP family serine protease